MDCQKQVRNCFQRGPSRPLSCSSYCHTHRSPSRRRLQKGWPAAGSLTFLSSGLSQLSTYRTRQRRQSRSPLDVKALVAVDYSQPALWLGLGLIGGGLGLYQLRRVQPVLSRDFDIVVSSISIFSGGILIFQGWRLDPLLLFCQLLTAGTALAWALEAINLRKVVDNDQRFDERTRQYPPLDEPMRKDGSLGRGIPLPAPRESDFGRWYGAPYEADLEELPTASGRDFYSGRGQDAYVPSARNGSSSSSWTDSGGLYDESGQDVPETAGEAYYEEEFYDDDAGRPADNNAEYNEPLAPSRRVVEDVEDYYNRKGGSVVEEVEKFYDGGRQRTAEERAQSNAQNGSLDYAEDANNGDGGQYVGYSYDQQQNAEYPGDISTEAAEADGYRPEQGYGEQDRRSSWRN